MPIRLKKSDLHPTALAALAIQGHAPKPRKKRPRPACPEPEIVGVGFCVPCEKFLTMNSRMHHHAKDRITEAQRDSAMAQALSMSFTRRSARVRFTIHGVSKMDDDQTRAAAKATRDGVAKAAGLNDGDAAWCWEYRQVESPGNTGWRGIVVEFLAKSRAYEAAERARRDLALHFAVSPDGRVDRIAEILETAMKD